MGSSGGYSSIIMIVLMLVIFYLFLILPENKKKKKLNEMRSNLKVGDDIVTIGGMMGKVVHVTDDSVTFETSEDQVRIQVAKWAISTNARAEAQAAKEAQERKEREDRAAARKEQSKHRRGRNDWERQCRQAGHPRVASEPRALREGYHAHGGRGQKSLRSTQGNL